MLQKKERKLAAEMDVKKKYRPSKNYVVREEDKPAWFRYVLARENVKIKSLERENKLMRDFSLAERKWVQAYLLLQQPTHPSENKTDST